MQLKVRILDVELEPPSYAHPGDAGLDLRARISTTLSPGGGRSLIPTGVAVELPADHIGLICPRSGMALGHGVTVLNGPGIVDSGYRGEIGVVLINLEPSDPFEISRGDRVAQLVIVPIASATVEMVGQLGNSERGESGFGRSGRK